MSQEEKISAYAKFFNKDMLSDCILEQTEPIKTDFKAHKIVLASGSEFFFKYFQDHKDLPHQAKIHVPKFIKPSYGFDNHDVFKKVLEFIYSNQTQADLVNLGLTPENAFSYLNDLAGLGHTKGIHLTKDFIKSKVINDKNTADCLLNAIKSDDKELEEKCIELLVPTFNTIIADEKKKSSIISLPYKMFKKILSKDNLTIQNENALLNLVIDYIKAKETLPEAVPEPNKPEEAKAPEPAKTNPPAEVKKEEPKPEEKQAEAKPAEEKPAGEKPAEEKKEEEKPKEEAAKPPEEPVEKKDEAPPAPEEKKEEPKPEKPAEEPKAAVEVLDFEAQAQIRLKQHKLTKDEKRDLIKLLRLTHLTHEALIKASNMELFAEFKDIFIESLSAKLNTYESAAIEKYSINMQPRHYTEPIASPTKTSKGPVTQKNPQSHPSTLPVGGIKPQNLPDQKVKADVARDTSPPGKIRSPEIYPSPTQMRATSPLGSPLNRSQQGFNMRSDRMQEYPPTQFSQSVDPRFFQGDSNSGTPMHYQTVKDPYYQTSPSKRTPEQLYGNKFSQSETRFQAPRGYGSPQNQQREQIMQGSYRSGGSFYKESPSRRSKIQQKPLVFSYEYDFDENGVLYYLGSNGKQFQWQNPHEIGQVQVFFSSLGKGALSDFVGRDCVNCRTQNEPNSFMALDLGDNRYLIPTCYSIRNRNSDHHILYNWILEGSVDLKEWFWLDKRIHYTEDQAFNQSVARTREELKTPGFTSTWGINENQIDKATKVLESGHGKFVGFRYFKLTQISKNSSGSYNLALSGFEVYGVGIGDNWLF